MMAVSPVPEGFHTATPNLICHDANEALGFYARAFGAQEIMRALGPDGQKIWHALMKIGDSFIMVADEMPEMGAVSPRTLSGTPVSMFLYVEDADALWKQATGAGATVVMEIMDAFWGDRCGTLTDPYGHQWTIATHIEEVSVEEATRRAKALYGSQPG